MVNPSIKLLNLPRHRKLGCFVLFVLGDLRVVSPKVSFVIFLTYQQLANFRLQIVSVLFPLPSSFAAFFGPKEAHLSQIRAISG